MKKIQLTRGKASLVDDSDFSILIRRKWRAKFRHGIWYAASSQYNPATKKQTDIQMHRLILNVAKGTRVDHRDGDGLNNQRLNLRCATVGQNRMNAVKRAKASSKYKGVHWNTEEGKWYAIIRKDRKRKWLGGFASEIDAAKAYDDAAAQMFGEFAKLNFPVVAT